MFVRYGKFNSLAKNLHNLMRCEITTTGMPNSFKISTTRTIRVVLPVPLADLIPTIAFTQQRISLGLIPSLSQRLLNVFPPVSCDCFLMSSSSWSTCSCLAAAFAAACSCLESLVCIFLGTKLLGSSSPASWASSATMSTKSFPLGVPLPPRSFHRYWTAPPPHPSALSCQAQCVPSHQT